MFSATITSGGLLLQESRILAELLLAGSSPDELLAMTLERNLLQKRSPMTTRKMVRLIIPRLADMERGFLEIVARGDKQEASLLLLASMITCHRLIGDFLLYIGRECIAQYKTAVTSQDWKQFLVQCAQLQPNVESWSPATVKKLKNVVFRLLVESGILESKTYRILPLFLPESVQAYLSSPKRVYARICMEGLL